jgi:hypothetical protein
MQCYVQRTPKRHIHASSPAYGHIDIVGFIVAVRVINSPPTNAIARNSHI